MAEKILLVLIDIFQEKNAEWQLADLLVPIRYPKFLTALLAQFPRHASILDEELKGRLGRDVRATISSVTDEMCIAAALWQRATRFYSNREFLKDPFGVVHFAFTPLLQASLSGVANALMTNLVAQAMEYPRPNDHLRFYLDEGRYLGPLTAVLDILARGRQSGLSAVLAVQSIKGLLKRWSIHEVEELLDVIPTWITHSAGPYTAKAFSEFVGQSTGVELSGSTQGYGVHVTGERYGMTGDDDLGDISDKELPKFVEWIERTKPEYALCPYTRHAICLDTKEGYEYTRELAETLWHAYRNFSPPSLSTGTSWGIRTKDAVTPGEAQALPSANPRKDELHSYCFNADIGVWYSKVRFLKHFADLPEPYFTRMPMRPPEHERLSPWTADDVEWRLHLNCTAPEMEVALKAYRAEGPKP